MTADDRTREATDAADDILGAGALAARTGARRGRGAAKGVPPVVTTSPASTAARTSDTTAPAIKPRASASTTTAGGLLHRSIYVTPAEWRAVQLAALAEGITAAEVVRRAIRAALDVGDQT